MATFEVFKGVYDSKTVSLAQKQLENCLGQGENMRAAWNFMESFIRKAQVQHRAGVYS